MDNSGAQHNAFSVTWSDSERTLIADQGARHARGRLRIITVGVDPLFHALPEPIRDDAALDHELATLISS